MRTGLQNIHTKIRSPDVCNGSYVVEMNRCTIFTLPRLLLHCSYLFDFRPFLYFRGHDTASRSWFVGFRRFSRDCLFSRVITLSRRLSRVASLSHLHLGTGDSFLRSSSGWTSWYTIDSRFRRRATHIRGWMVLDSPAVLWTLHAGDYQHHRFIFS